MRHVVGLGKIHPSQPRSLILFVIRSTTASVYELVLLHDELTLEKVLKDSPPAVRDKRDVVRDVEHRSSDVHDSADVGITILLKPEYASLQNPV